MLIIPNFRINPNPQFHSQVHAMSNQFSNYNPIIHHAN